MANCEAEGAIGVVAFPDPKIYNQDSSTSDTVWLPFPGIIRDTARSTYGDPGSLFYPALDGKDPEGTTQILVLYTCVTESFQNVPLSWFGL